MDQTLKKCKKLKDMYHNTLFNVACLIFIVGGTALFLNYKYIGVMDTEKKTHKEQQKKKYILGQIQKMQQLRTSTSADLITNLPIWNGKNNII